jgi:hypothetical protein
MSTAIATFSPVVAIDQVTSRTANWTLVPGGTGTPVTTTHSLPPTATTDTLPCSPGDVVSVDVDDTNAVGNSQDSNILSGTAPSPAPTAVPTTPTALTLSFTNP